jgi:hypothetical protein
VTVEPTTASVLEPVLIRGSGWTSGGQVSFEFCAAGLPAFDGCDTYTTATVREDGTWEGHASVLAYLKVFDPYFNWRTVDCTTAPGACEIRVRDTRISDEPLIRVPMTVLSPAAPPGTVTLDLQTPLVAELPVRLEGSGWGPSRWLNVWQCKGEGVSLCRSGEDTLNRSNGFFTKADGSFRVYFHAQGVLYSEPVHNCMAEPGACAFVISDPAAITKTAVRVPLTFSAAAQTVDVTSRYEPEWGAMLEQGLAKSALSEGDFQRHGMAVLVWTLAVSGASSGPRLPTAGSIDLTSTYDYHEYLQRSRDAALRDYTLQEMQKVGSLFYAWVLAGQPPLGQ